VASIYITNLFSLNCMDWIFKNITHWSYRAHTKNWWTTFKVMCWNIAGGETKLSLRRIFIGLLI